MSTEIPSILTDKLTKLYGKVKAINNVSFAVNPDEIVGFLGLNGAGKTTTMFILSGLSKPPPALLLSIISPSPVSLKKQSLT